MKKWFTQHKSESALVLLLLLSIFLRFYKIDQYMTFLGDEGRDAIVVKGIVTAQHFPLLGPVTSIGNMYLGPLYYYMMALPMRIFYLNPVAAAGLDALLGVLAVLLVYFLARRWFGQIGAYLGALLYSISPVNIIHSRSSWNPNPAPFFALLTILGIDQARRTKNFNWFILTGASLAFIAQMHYLALIMVPIVGVLWAWEGYQYFFKGKARNNFWLGTTLAVVAFVFLMSPLLFFDLRHNFMNFKAISAFFTNRQTTVNLNILNTLSRIEPVYMMNLIGNYLAGMSGLYSVILGTLVVIPLLYFVYQILFRKKGSWPLYALLVWLLGGIVGLALYKQTIYDHYLGFLNPVPYLLLAGLIGIFKNQKLKLGLAGAILVLGLFANLPKNPLLASPNNQLKRTQQLTQVVIEKAGNKPFNFALLAEHNYDSAYQYYFDLYDHKPKDVTKEIADQLFVVCEDVICQPVNNPKYEIAAFGWSKVDYETEVLGVKLFKLSHNPRLP